MNILWILFLSLISFSAFAGPPYMTDDPEPVEYEHWEFYLSSLSNHEPGSCVATLPEVEVNYGAIKNVQLHIIMPFAFVSQTGSATHYGYGDTEVGIKYRFVQETESRPQIGTFPHVELPTGNKNKGLGSGYMQTFLPIWIQKSFGNWTTYGGGGYWINPGPGNKNWVFLGGVIQRTFNEHLKLGTELFYSTPKQQNEGSDIGFNLGGTIDINDTHHLPFSFGRDIYGDNLFQGYFGYQLTF